MLINIQRKTGILLLVLAMLLIGVGAGPVFAVELPADSLYRFDTAFFGRTYDYVAAPAPTTDDLLWPRSLARDAAGNFYTVEMWNTTSRIHKISPTGTHVSVWGSNGTGDGQFSSPMGLALDSAGNIYVSDINGHRLQKFNSSGAYVSTFTSWGTGVAPDNLISPYNVAVDSSDNIYITNTGRNNIVKLNPDMTFNSVWSSPNSPASIYIDASGLIYVGEQYGSTISVYNTSGVLQTSFTVSESGIASITKDISGNIYVGAGGKIIKLGAGFSEQYKWDYSNSSYNGSPYGIVVDDSGTIYVLGSDRILKSRIASTNNYLSALDVNGQTLIPVFDKNTTDYTVNVTSDVTSVDITATKEDSNAIIKVNNAVVNSGEPKTYELGLGENIINFEVTPEIGAEKTYKITVNVAVPPGTIFIRASEDSNVDNLGTYYEDGYNYIYGDALGISSASLKFDLSPLAGKTVTGAKFYTKIEGSDSAVTGDPMTYDLVGSLDDSWSDGVSFPSSEDVVIITNAADMGSGGSNYWQVFDSTELKDFIVDRFSAQLTSPQYCTLLIEPNANYPSGFANMIAKETASPADQPYLLITYTEGPYNVTYDGNEETSGSVPSDTTSYANGAEVTVAGNTGSLAKDGYAFAGWNTQPDGSGTAYPAATGTFNITGDTTLYARWIPVYSLTYTAGANGSISGTSPQTVISGESGTEVTAQPDTGYHFVSWSDGVLTAARTDNNVTGSKSVTATFAIDTYTLTYTAGANGSITGTASQTVNYGGDGTEVAAAADPGYHFVSWSDGVLTAARTDSNVTGNKSVTAAFALNTFTLTYTAGANGSISGTASQTVNEGNDGTEVVAVPDTGYHFVGWSDGVLTAARTDTAVTSNKSVTANFAADTFTLTYTADAGGTISGAASQTVNYGSNGTEVTAQPDAGYHFVSWSDGVLTAARTDNNVTGNQSVSAAFAIDTYTLTYTAGANGSITGTSTQTVNYGGDGTEVTAAADAGYHFVGWSDGVLTAARTDSNVTGNKSVTAAFALDAVLTAPIINTQPSNAVINVGGSAGFTVAASGSSLTYQWQADTGSGFNDLSDGGVYSGAVTDTLTITGATVEMDVYSYRVVVTGEGGLSSTSNSATLTVNTLSNAAVPTINTQPANQSVNTGETANLSVAVSGGVVLSYQWYSNVTESNSGGTLIPGATADTYSAPTATVGTTYYYCVITNTDSGATGVQTAAAATNPAMVVVEERHSSGGNSTTDSQSDPGTNILVNGQNESAGTSTTTTVGSQTVTTITIDPEKLVDRLEQEGKNAVVTVPVNTNADVIVGQLNGQVVKNMETKEAVLEIKTENITYTLPAAQINIDSVSNQLGQQVQLQDIKVNVTINVPPAETARIVENTANKNNYQLVVKPIEFNITCTSGSKTVDVARFNGYVERMVAIPEGVDPAKITTGIVLNADGTFSHVPTQVISVNGKYYAKINSLTNSTYSVIYHPIEFADMNKHWAKEAVNDLGSRLVVTGYDKETYRPDGAVTRAEFAAIVVKALGLRNPQKSIAFPDVAADGWYYEAVRTAYDYGIIRGYTDGTFRPNGKITREEAMTMISKAMAIAKLDSNLTDSEAAAQLAGFADGKNVSGWAKLAVADTIKKGIVTGHNGRLFVRANITRAETAVMVRNVLRKAELI